MKLEPYYGDKSVPKWNYDPYDWICDRCGRIIFNEQFYSFIDMTERIRNNQLVIQRSKKGKWLHYCNQICKDLHRGPKYRENLYLYD
jgi:hypothetical protein